MDPNFNTTSEQQTMPESPKQEVQSILVIIGQYLFKLVKVVFFAILFFALSFHWMPDHGYIFPKEQLSFANTVISHEDIDQLIERHNEASGFERALIRQECIYQKMVEIGVIIQDSDSE